LGYFFQNENHLAAPICILYQKDEDRNRIWPVAIQINKDGSLYTPTNSEELEWLLVKCWAGNGSAVIHQMISHWLRTHAISEPFAMATKRNLSQAHPIHKLLEPHLKYTIGINAKARDRLIGQGGLLELFYGLSRQVMTFSADIYQKYWTFPNQALPVDLANRGTMDKEALPFYPYRDDGMKIWTAIEKYFTAYVHLYYPDNKAILEDNELQAWYIEIKTVGFEEKADTFPDLANREVLIRTLTTVAWFASGHHSSVNFSMYHYYSWPPNMPSKMRKLPPHKSNGVKITEKFLCESLPSPSESGIVLTILSALSTHASPEAEEYLGTTHRSLIRDPKALELLNAFRGDLKRIDDEIDHENQTHPQRVIDPYIYLQPKRVPNSISI